MSTKLFKEDKTMSKNKITDIERQRLQYISNLCNEASDETPERDNFLTDILKECDRLADKIDEYLETH